MFKPSLLAIAITAISSSTIAQAPKLILPIGHTESINDAQYSADGKRILTVSDDKTADIWDAETGILLGNLKGHKSAIFSGNFSPNGNFILTVSNDNSARIWNSISGDLISKIDSKKAEIIEANFSKDGSFIYATFSDASFRIYDPKSGDLKMKIQNTEDSMKHSVISGSNTEAITFGGKKFAQTWSLNSGKQIAKLMGHTQTLNDADYSTDGSKIVTGSEDSTAIVYDKNGSFLYHLKCNNKVLYSKFTTDNKKVCTSTENVIILWDINTGKPLTTIASQKDLGKISQIQFSRDGQLLAACYENAVQIWDANSGRTIRIIDFFDGVNSIQFNIDGTKFVTGLQNQLAQIWDINTEEPILDLDGHTYPSLDINYSPDGNKIVTANDDGIARIWDNNSKIINLLIGHTNAINSAEFSKDGKLVITTSDDSTIKIWDANNSKLIQTLKGHQARVSSASISSDQLKIISTSNDSSSNFYVWSKSLGKYAFVKKIKNPDAEIEKSIFSADAQRFLVRTQSGEGSFIQLYDASNGNLITSFKELDQKIIWDASFSPDSKKIIILQENQDFFKIEAPQIWDATDGHFIGKIILDNVLFIPQIAVFNPDGTKILFGGLTDQDALSIRIFDIKSNKIFSTLKNLPSKNNVSPTDLRFSPNGQKVIISFGDNSARLWDVNSGDEKAKLKGHTDDVRSAQFSPDGNYIITNSLDNTFKKWTSNGELLYTFFAVDNQFDYLAIDPYDRYDGTSEARKLLYFTCGTEVIELEQFEDLSWQPGLIPMILGTNKLPITAKKLSEIQICNNTPTVIQKGINNGKYEFLVIPRNGGIGTVQLFINSKLRTEYPLNKLSKNNEGYLLSVQADELRPYFVSGKANTVSVKATTTNGEMTSRGGVVETAVLKKDNNVVPNIYLVSIGINQYKGDKLKLNYASTDAESFASAVTASAIKLLGNAHVFTYTFSTEKGNLNWPSKNLIQQKIEEISKTAKADDIFVLFFAGHGVLLSGQKNFFILTADASSFELNGVEKDVAISTDELNEWMRKIKANKQLLILDACNSGKALEDIQNQISRRDIPPDQVKALENLKDKTGIFILSASASGQSAFEASQFGQGLLTYSLLSGIKLGTGLKDDKFIDVTRWFNNASDNVRELAKSIGGRQEPQIVGNASFDVGIADREVKDGIHINSEPKKIFSRSVLFTGDVSLLIDDIQLGGDFDKELALRSSMGKQSILSFIGTYRGEDAYSIRGSYDVQGNALTIKVHLVAQKKGVGNEIIKTGSLEQKDQLIKSVLDDISLLIK